jgi:hypothetical protein
MRERVVRGRRGGEPCGRSTPVVAESLQNLCLSVRGAENSQNSAVSDQGEAGPKKVRPGAILNLTLR